MGAPLSPGDIANQKSGASSPTPQELITSLPPVPGAMIPERKEPIVTERTPQENDQQAQISKERGVRFPMPQLRPTPPKKTQEDGSSVVAKIFAPQMGTSPELMANMQNDERKWGVLKENEVPAIAHMSYRNVYDGVRYWGHIVEWQLTGSQGVNGLARNHALQMMANSSGGAAIKRADKPNAIARNLWNRDWREKAQERGEYVEGEG